MWESRRPLARFPRGSWKEGEACFWLSTLFTAPAFPRLSWLSFFAGGFAPRPWLVATTPPKTAQVWAVHSRCQEAFDRPGAQIAPASREHCGGTLRSNKGSDYEQSIPASPQDLDRPVRGDRRHPRSLWVGERLGLPDRREALHLPDGIGARSLVRHGTAGVCRRDSTDFLRCGDQRISRSPGAGEVSRSTGAGPETNDLDEDLDGEPWLENPIMGAEELLQFSRVRQLLQS